MHSSDAEDLARAPAHAFRCPMGFPVPAFVRVGVVMRMLAAGQALSMGTSRAPNLSHEG
eukprot:CAMPEP_0181208426 /NCGR_PEP_ID=MMETSP1096-20121128/22110_1 /TAXON_ID=156174 ORGANISM="Chrysochromulina ericina, Strain CCMP281" /NCGR_SAMPLE_ID=MMETSP1096 /ASSEMBLY_ACC=CAM_ASM_000453 /LENGTH=58 /DNA_ID=CAMNT_0023299487 /DNA_START=284 /DNA_END=460 /DNA_ORIENTATION=+